ncbi:uncharacterized protein LOC108087139 [Drosophila ficusphila]|uniref:uncharacterized protein LOC108087139 n=1 Tax=Drosophila ficusphila TaxID=30025 RepID=UPI0007E7CE4C|nr:uncharacterized protein LOC108087139 [Drosophila ficusphila]
MEAQHMDAFFEGDEDERSNEDYSVLYYFTKLYDLFSGLIFMTTYVERCESEYFSGFSNVQLVAAFQGDQQAERFRWLHLSLIFRASRSPFFG